TARWRTRARRERSRLARKPVTPWPVARSVPHERPACRCALPPQVCSPLALPTHIAKADSESRCMKRLVRQDAEDVENGVGGWGGIRTHEGLAPLPDFK